MPSSKSFTNTSIYLPERHICVKHIWGKQLWKYHWLNLTYRLSLERHIRLIWTKAVPARLALQVLLNEFHTACLHDCRERLSVFQQPPRTEKSCSCWRRNKPNKCPLEGDCKDQLDVVYHAKIEGQEEKQYISRTVHFKKRYYGHTNSFRNEDYKYSTTLSTYVWEKGLNPEPRIMWSIIGKATSYRKGSRCCDFCLTE